MSKGPRRPTVIPTVLLVALVAVSCASPAPVGEATTTPPTVGTSTASTVPDTTSPTVTSTTENTASTTTAPDAPTSIPAAATPPAVWIGVASGSGVVHGFVDGAEAWTADVGQADHVRVGPGGDAVVGTCCEPAAGRVATITAAGSVVSEFATVGVYPAISVDGSLVATIHQPGGLIVTLVGDNTDVLNLPPYPDELIADTDPIGLSDLALSLDSTTLAFTYDTASRPPILLTLGVDAANLGDATQVPGPDSPMAWVLPAFTNQGMAAVGVEVTPPHELSGPTQVMLIDPDSGTVVRELATTTSPVVDLDSDPTGTWLIYVLDDGSVHYVGLDGEGGTLASEGFSSASW